MRTLDETLTFFPCLTALHVHFVQGRQEYLIPQPRPGMRMVLKKLMSLRLTVLELWDLCHTLVTSLISHISCPAGLTLLELNYRGDYPWPRRSLHEEFAQVFKDLIDELVRLSEVSGGWIATTLTHLIISRVPIPGEVLLKLLDRTPSVTYLSRKN